MSDTHASHDSHVHGHGAEAPKVPTVVKDEAGDSPSWLPALALIPIAVVVFYLFGAPLLPKLFTAGRATATQEQGQ